MVQTTSEAASQYNKGIIIQALGPIQSQLGICIIFFRIKTQYFSPVVLSPFPGGVAGTVSIPDKKLRHKACIHSGIYTVIYTPQAVTEKAGHAEPFRLRSFSSAYHKKSPGY